MTPVARVAPLLVFVALAGAGGTGPTQDAPREFWREVEVIRTAHGVPHIRATNLAAAGYALAWLQLEDYGPETALNVLAASGRMASVWGHDSIESDFVFRRVRERAIATYPLLDQPTRDVYDGFAAGIDRYITLHRDEFPDRMPSDFTGYDVSSLEVGRPSGASARRFLAHRAGTPSASGSRGGGDGAGDASPVAGIDPVAGSGEEAATDDDIGSNAWAFAPSRTTSRHAILLRNPHLSWSAGYYEAQLTVPGVVDFYGDFRIGSPFAVIGGFNRDLGWATTNNAQRRDEVYALDADPAAVDHYLLDGASLPLGHELVTVEFRNGEALSSETREFWTTSLGPVIERADGRIYVLRTAGDGEYRSGEQFLRMMRATSLAEWQAAMRMRARLTSNFTYADRAGNIYYVWNAALPVLPHPSGGDTVAIPVHATGDAWTRYVPFDSLPQVLDPRGGYVHNENSSPHFTNVRQPIDTTNAYPNFEAPALSLRSQLSLQLVGGTNRVSLADVVRLKHSYRMLLADRVKPDLVRAVRATGPTGEVANALALVAAWDNTASPGSRGSVLFDTWWQRYAGREPDSLRFARVWTAADPLETPRGLADPSRAADAFAWAVTETARRHGTWDVAWGDVHRVRRGDVDVPVGGCSGALGCFRVLTFAPDSADGRLVANGGDGWVLAVEFGDVPRAYSVLAYGESARPESPWYADQAAMFARGELKPVAYTAADIDRTAVQRYRPGAP